MAIRLEILAGGTDANILKTVQLKPDEVVKLKPGDQRPLSILIPSRSMTSKMEKDEEGNKVHVSVKTVFDLPPRSTEVPARKVNSAGWRDYVVEGYAIVKDGQLNLVQVNKRVVREKEIAGKIVQTGDEVVGKYQDGGAFPKEVLVFVEGVNPNEALPAYFKSDTPKIETVRSKVSFGKFVPLSHQRRFSSKP